MKKIAKFLMVAKNYALLVGIGLFLLGFLGFILKSSSTVPNSYLLTAIIAGFWGIIVSLNDSTK